MPLCNMGNILFDISGFIREKNLSKNFTLGFYKLLNKNIVKF